MFLFVSIVYFYLRVFYGENDLRIFCLKGSMLTDIYTFQSQRNGGMVHIFDQIIVLRIPL